MRYLDNPMGALRAVPDRAAALGGRWTPLEDEPDETDEPEECGSIKCEWILAQLDMLDLVIVSLNNAIKAAEWAESTFCDDETMLGRINPGCLTARSQLLLLRNNLKRAMEQSEQLINLYTKCCL